MMSTAPFCRTATPPSKRDTSAARSSAGVCGVYAERLTEARKLDDIGRDDRTPVAADDTGVLADHEEAIRVKYDEHTALARDRHCHLSEGLHVRLAT